MKPEIGHVDSEAKMEEVEAVPEGDGGEATGVGETEANTAGKPPVRDAFSVLMTKKRPGSPTLTTPPAPAHKDAGRRPHLPGWRTLLLQYLENPETLPNTVLVRLNDNFVTIHDAYPKSTIHLLMLLRDMNLNTLHPIDVLSNHPKVLEEVKKEVEIVKKAVAKEMERRFGYLRWRNQQKKNDNEGKNTASDSDEDDNAWESWLPHIRSGIHSSPSMAHLHIHILTPDMVSPTDALKHRKHYNSFNTGFFVPLEDFPLTREEGRRKRERAGEELKEELRCWRCKKGFGSSIVKLKEHLVREREGWIEKV